MLLVKSFTRNSLLLFNYFVRIFFFFRWVFHGQTHLQYSLVPIYMGRYVVSHFAMLNVCGLSLAFVEQKEFDVDTMQLTIQSIVQIIFGWKQLFLLSFMHFLLIARLQLNLLYREKKSVLNHSWIRLLLHFVEKQTKLFIFTVK